MIDFDINQVAPSFLITFIVVNTFGTLLMFGLTQHIELRGTRWPKMLASYPVLTGLATLLATHMHTQLDVIFSIILYSFCAVLFAVIWGHNVTHLMAVMISNIVDGGGKPNRTLKPDLRFARQHIKEDEFPEAVEALKNEIEKDEFHFEALHLLAAVYKELKQYQPALDCVAKTRT